MKKLLLFFVLLLGLPSLATSDTLSSPLKSHVDECFELTSIVFRLAGAPEYSQCSVPVYARDIDSTFAPFKDHQLILYAKELRKGYGISFNAISSAAACLEIKNGKVVIKPGVDISKINEVDKRWTPQTFKTFLSHLNDFYKKTKFRDFYTQHADLYATATQSLDKQLANIDLDWFESVFDEKLGSPLVIASLTNGLSNYAFQVPDKSKQFGIAVGTKSDNKGMPAYPLGSASVILHEFLHKYANPRIDNYWNQIDSSAQKIYSHVENMMYKIGYGNARATIIEWFDNLLVNLYFKQHLEIQKAMNYSVSNFIAMDQNKGFIWMDRSMLLMQHFLDNRDRYPQIDDFMPQVVNFINYTADNFDQVLDEFNHRQPYIVDMYPSSGSTITADIDTIVFRFSEPMLPLMGFNYSNDTSIFRLPLPKKPEWKDEYTLVIPMGELEKGKTYGVVLPSTFFMSKKRYTMKERVEYTFKTAE